MEVPGILKFVLVLAAFGIVITILSLVLQQRADSTGEKTGDGGTGTHHKLYGTDKKEDTIEDGGDAGSRCYVLVDMDDIENVKPRACPPTGYSIKKRTTMEGGTCESVLNSDHLEQPNQAKSSVHCCMKRAFCNAERYCGEGIMECFKKNGSETTVCVCPKGLMGHRCEKCSEKQQVPCLCNRAYGDSKESTCETSYYNKSSLCLTNHTVGGEEVSCLCKPGMYKQHPDIRCTGDPEHCADTTP